VRHAAIDDVLAARVRKEFNAALPARVVLPSEQSFLACEFAAKQIDAVAKYIIGIAAALSKDFEYAEQLLLDAEGRLTRYLDEVQGGVPLSVLLERVQARLRELYETWLRRLVYHYTLKRDAESLRLAEPVIEKLRRYESDNYGAHLTAAMCAFVLRKDTVAAMREIEACRSSSDSTWLYSMAFLEAYSGNLDAAYRSYAKAFRAPLANPTVPTQTEEFIQIVLDEAPERYWLFYCLGLINYRAKHDNEAAKTDFMRFLDRADPDRFPKAVESARKWLRELEGVSATTGVSAGEGSVG
jgi:hypothetical protein